MAGNANKHKVYVNGSVLYAGAGVGQNLGTDLDGNTADELDTILHSLFGPCVIGAGALAVSAGSGLAVNVAAGFALVTGQHVKGAAGSVTGLPNGTAGIKIYAEAGTPFNNPTRAWPAAFGWTVGALSGAQMLLATVTTAGGTVTVVTDARVVLGLVAPLLPTSGQRDALAGNQGTPGSANRYVTEQGMIAGVSELLPTILANAVI